MAGAADKQAILVGAISDGVKTGLASEFAGLTKELAKLSVSNNAILARIEVLESVLAGGSAAKRTVRTGAPAKGAAKRPAAKKGGSSDDKQKVTNALLYFRYALANDLDDARETWGTEENIAAAEQDALVSKRVGTKETDPSSYWSAVGAALWKTCTSEQKDETRSKFLAWKESTARDEGDEPLQEEGATNGQ